MGAPQQSQRGAKRAKSSHGTGMMGQCMNPECPTWIPFNEEMWFAQCTLREQKWPVVKDVNLGFLNNIRNRYGFRTNEPVYTIPYNARNTQRRYLDKKGLLVAAGCSTASETNWI